ncbi:MAG: hypothetical protein IJF15_02695, partial [Oscillospiraceae bacterium]|nr:hypothetical protein [Oscillospiraceae bacterium]
AFAKNVSGETDAQIAAYLETYLGMGIPHGNDGFLMVLFTYFRYPVVLFLLGFASVGVLLLPMAVAAQGFFLSFALCCFSSALGREGMPLVFAAFALRCLLTVTCGLYLASHALLSSWSLAQLSFGRAKGKRGGIVGGREQFLRFGICSLLLLVGSFVELAFLPRFLAWIAL